MVCETKHKKHFENSEFGAVDIEELPNEYTSYIIRWWKDANKLEKEIDNRTCGLGIEKLEYLIATKKNIERVPKKYQPCSDTW